MEHVCFGNTIVILLCFLQSNLIMLLCIYCSIKLSVHLFLDYIASCAVFFLLVFLSRLLVSYYNKITYAWFFKVCDICAELCDL